MTDANELLECALLMLEACPACQADMLRLNCVPLTDLIRQHLGTPPGQTARQAYFPATEGVPTAQTRMKAINRLTVSRAGKGTSAKATEARRRNGKLGGRPARKANG